MPAFPPFQQRAALTDLGCGWTRVWPVCPPLSPISAKLRHGYAWHTTTHASSVPRDWFTHTRAGTPLSPAGHAEALLVNPQQGESGRLVLSSSLTHSLPVFFFSLFAFIYFYVDLRTCRQITTVPASSLGSPHPIQRDAHTPTAIYDRKMMDRPSQCCPSRRPMLLSRNMFRPLRTPDSGAAVVNSPTPLQ